MASSTMPESRYYSSELVVSTAICPPGPRVVVLSVFHDIDDEPAETDYSAYEVVAVRSTVVRHYGRRGYADAVPGPEATHREMVRAGWRYEGEHVSDVFLVASEDQVVPASEVECPHATNRMVVCTWPPEQDAERFEAIASGIWRRLGVRPVLAVAKLA